MYASKSRQVKLQDTKELLYRHAEEIAKDAPSWMNFLDTASRLYRYPFADIVLIHAQKPEARSVASYDIWSQKMHRYIKRGTKGIALIEDLWAEPHMRYVYDISDTGMTRLSRTPVNWEITDEIEDDMREHMIATYGLEDSLADTYERSLMFTAFQVCEGREKEILEVMYRRDAASGNGALLKNLREDMLDGQVVTLLSNSLMYLLMRRSGVDPMGILAEGDFTPWLTGLDNFELLEAVGNVMMEQANLILHDIYRTTVRIANEKVKNTVDTISKESYTTINKTMRSSEVSRTVAETPAALRRGQAAEHSRNGGQEHGHSVHSQRGLPVPESDRDAGSGRERRDREIRDNAHGISSDTPARGLPEPPLHGGSPEALREGERRGDGADGVPHVGTDGALPGSGTGSDDGRLELHGVEEQHREDGGGDRPGGPGVHAVERNAETEEDERSPEETEEVPPGLSLPDLPSMQEQVRELQRLEDAAFAAESSVPVDVIDEFLRHGGAERNSLLRIIYNFMISQTDIEYTEFIRREYSGLHRGHYMSYRGLQMDGIPYTAGWSEDGLVIAAGRSLDGIRKTRLTWAEVSGRTEQLLLAGQYAPQEVLDSARENAVQEHAEILHLFYSNLSPEARELFTHVDDSLLRGEYPDFTAQLREALGKPGFLQGLYADLRAVQGYGENNPENLWEGGNRRGTWIARPPQMTALFYKFKKPAIPYRQDPGFTRKSIQSFIPQEVVDGELRRSRTKDANYRIFSFFLTHKDKKERANYLKEEFGVGGYSGSDIYDIWHDAKGIRIRIMPWRTTAPEADIQYPWPKAVARIAELMNQGTYLTEEQFYRLDAYELNAMAERVAVFYQSLPEDIATDFRPPKTGNYAWEMQTATDAAQEMGYAGMLTEAGRDEMLYQDMLQAFVALPSDHWRYQELQQTVQDIRLYLDGKYTIFPGLERVKSTDATPTTEKDTTARGTSLDTLGEGQATEHENSRSKNEKIQADHAEKLSGERTVSTERKNLPAPEEKGWGEAETKEEAAAAEPENHPGIGKQGTEAENKEKTADSMIAEQRNKLEKKSRRAPKKKKKRDHTETMKAFHGFPDNVSNGQGQQMSLFDFMSSDGSGFDAMKFATEELPVEPVSNETAAEAEEPKAREPRAEESADESVLEEVSTRETDDGENAFEEEAATADVESLLSEEEEDLAFVSNLIQGESAFVTAQAHYLIREILFADRVVSAQDMDYAETAGGQIYQTFTFHEVRAIYDRMQDMEPEAAESEATAEPEEMAVPEVTEEAEMPESMEAAANPEDAVNPDITEPESVEREQNREETESGRAEREQNREETEPESAERAQGREETDTGGAEREQDQEETGSESANGAQEPEDAAPGKDSGIETVALYQSASAMQDGFMENIAIQRYPNGMFYNHYGYDDERGMGTATAGGFDTLEDARQTVLAHRPDALEIIVRYASSSWWPNGALDYINILLLPNGKFYGYYDSAGDESITSEPYDTLEDAMREVEETEFRKIYQSETFQENPERFEDRETEVGAGEADSGEANIGGADTEEEGFEEAETEGEDSEGTDTEEEFPTDIPGQEAFIQERINYRITDDTLGEGGPKEKFRRNLAAIRTLKQIEAENRLATAEEQEILAQYVGWGGLPQAFLSSTDVAAGKTSTEGAWADEQRQLLEALTPQEYSDARESTLTSFYTPPVVIRAMYQALANFGFTSGNVLEPSCGIGNFMGLVPDTMDASMYGVELDSVSGRIAGQLYQKNQILVQGFETARYPDNFFDVVIGNVPFGDFSVSDPRYQRSHFSIHEYFIAKSLDLVRPGGIVAVVTSSYTMDKKDSTVRRYIANRADLLGAIRLPNNTFAKNAGTTVVSDILFLQKRDRAVIEEPLWVDNPSGEFNPYFQAHSSMVFGRIEEVSGRFGMQETVLPYENNTLENLLNLVIPLIDGSIPEVDVDETAEIEGVDLSMPAYPDVRNYSYTVVNDKIYYREDSRMNQVEVPKNAQGRMKGMIELSFLVRELLHAQMEESREDEILPLQTQLNEQYDAFVESWGRISTPANRKVFQKDSSYSLLASLEVLDDEGNFDHKADVFSKRTISRAVPVSHVDTASEALAVCIGELARVDLGRMSELTGKTEEEVERELSGVIFRNIVGSETPSDNPLAFPKLDSFSVVTSDEYLSGNVRSKLRMARAYYEAMGERVSAEEKQRILTNITSLEAVQPEDLKASEIEVRVGTTWIPLEYYNDFLYETFHISYWEQRSISVEYSEETGAWFVRGKTRISTYNSDAYQMYGTSRASGLRLYEDALNLRSTKIYDVVQDDDGKQKRILNATQTVLAQQKQELLCEHFKDWIYKTIERRERLEKIYNEKFNNTRPREYDGSHITFVGMSPEIHLMEHQRNAVAHILYGKNTLLAHCVGAGKTYEMVAAGMESRRLGLSKKCMYVVPNHLTEQWAAEFLTLYPAANILAATKKDFEPANRKKFCSRIATGDYDAIIIGHSQFEKIPLSPERQASILKRQIDDITKAISSQKEKSGKGDFSIKQMEKTKKMLQARLDKLNNQERKDRVVTFEELGVDRLFVDESHNYKNLFLYTKMTNVAGISQTDAQKSSDMFAKCQYLDEITGGRGVVFATGTPISNSAVELYTLMRYLQYDTLEKMGMTNFDSWASTFGETVNAIELAPEGTGYRSKTRFAHFYNLPELTSIFREVADVKTADMLNLPVPEAEYINETIQASGIQKEMVESFGKRADQIRKGIVDPRIDNMLKITNDGRKCALDERLLNDLLPDEEESKVNRCVSNTYEIWEETAENRSTQMIFCDMSTPKGDGTFNVYDDIRDKLTAKGIPKEEIAFIHEYNTEAQKAELFKKVRSGVIRILLGSTQKMGAGTNAQDRLIALHHLDCPWKPSDLQQQEGRILRQGNRNKKVKIFRYVTEGTFDSYMWQLLENKQKFIGQIMTSKCPARSMQDVDDAALTYAEIKMLAAGDTKIKEKMTLDVEVSKLKTAKSNYMSQKYDLETKVAVTYPQTIQALKERLEGLKKDAAEAKRILELEKSGAEDAFRMQIGSNVYTDTKEAGKSLVSRCKQLKGSVGNTYIGSYHGFELYAAYLFGTTFDVRLTLRGSTSTEIKLSSDPVGNITRIHNALGKFDEKIEESERKRAETESMLEAAKENLQKPFELEEELQTKQARLNELDAELNINP